MPNIFIQIYSCFTKIERRIFNGSVIIFIISGIIFSALVFQIATIKIPAPSNKYREGIVGQPISINPIIAGTNDTDRDLVELLFDSFMNLIKDYKISDDRQTYTIILKDNLRWSDGKSLTSDDVIFTIDTIQNAGSRSPLLQTWQGVIADRISEREIELTLRTPYAYFLDNLRELKIIPKHIFEVIPAENFRLSNFNLEPVGNGPYQFSSFEKKNSGFITVYHLKTNEYYANRKPLIKEFDLMFYPSTADLVKAFNNGGIDGFGGINQKLIRNISLNHMVLEKIIPEYYAIFLNKNSKSALNDENVIKALNLAVNKQEIVNQVFDGKAIIINEPILPIINGYDKLSDPGNEFSLEKANELLNKTKWAYPKPDGEPANAKNNIRERKSQKQTEFLEFSVVVPQISFLTETIEIIKNDWEKIGVKLNSIALNPADITNEVLKTRNYEMIILGNILKNNPDIFSFWHSSQRFYPGLNLALYENKKVDALLESIRKNTDETSQKEELSNLQQLISNDNPAIFLYSPLYLYITPESFGGFNEKIINTPSERFQNASKWYLETQRVFK